MSLKLIKLTYWNDSVQSKLSSLHLIYANIGFLKYERLGGTYCFHLHGRRSVPPKQWNLPTSLQDVTDQDTKTRRLHYRKNLKSHKLQNVTRRGPVDLRVP